MDTRSLSRSIALGRVAFGAAMLLAPGALLRASADADGPLVWMCRAFGIRDIVLGAGALTAPDGEEAHWIRWGAIADTSDAVAALVWRRELGPALTGVTLALAVPAAAGGWMAST
jgi:hypothetical protein